MTRSRKGAELLTAYESGGLGQFKNRIINGAMVIDQRNAGASVTPTAGNQYALDRWVAALTQASKYSVQQVASGVVGFTSCLKVASTSSYAVLSSDAFSIGQRIEGFNVGDLYWGGANASTVTLSFWVYSSLTGAFGGSLRNSSNTRSYPFSYTINSANTWEQKSITIAGDTTGTWLTDNGIGIQVNFALGAGSTFSSTAGAWASGNYIAPTGATSVVGTNGATFYITGVQLEKGSTATSFDYRPYGTELALCQRYYQAATVYVPDVSNLPTNWYYKVSMRATPTVTGSGTGFSTFTSTSEAVACRQTSAAAGNLTATAEL